jgi:hypothetical protein
MKTIKQIKLEDLPFPEWLGTERVARYKLPYFSELVAADPDSPGENIGGGETILLLVMEDVNFVIFAGEIVGKHLKNERLKA